MEIKDFIPAYTKAYRRVFLTHYTVSINIVKSMLIRNLRYVAGKINQPFYMLHKTGVIHTHFSYGLVYHTLPLDMKKFRELTNGIMTGKDVVFYLPFSYNSERFSSPKLMIEYDWSFTDQGKLMGGVVNHHNQNHIYKIPASIMIKEIERELSIQLSPTSKNFEIEISQTDMATPRLLPIFDFASHLIQVNGNILKFIKNDDLKELLHPLMLDIISEPVQIRTRVMENHTVIKP